MTTFQSCPTCGTALDPDASGGLCPVCLFASVLDPPEESFDTTLPPGAMVGAFQITGLLGKGGMATVYEAYDPSLDRSVALKVLPPHFLHEPAFARRFRREAKVIARLEHPNIVPIYASGIDDGIPWMSMRLLSAGSLGSLVEGTPLSVEKSLHILRKVADALEYAHARGIVHRDVKPTNILLGANDRVCVADFGLAYIRDFTLQQSASMTIAGTPHYMAPEQGLGKDVDHRADIYSLGVLAYEMLTGTVPFTAESPVAILMKHVNDPPPTPQGLATPVVRALHKALAKDPNARWGSAGAFVNALESGLLATETFTQRASGFAKRHAAPLAFGAAMLILIGGLMLSGDRMTETPTVNQDVGLSVSEPVAAVPERAQPVAAPASAPGKPTGRAGTAPIEAARVVSAPVALLSSTDAHALDGQVVLGASPSAQVVADTESATPRAAPESINEPAGVPPPAVESRQVPEQRPPPSDDVVTPPMRMRTVSPAYPPVARAARIAGDVGLKATVGTDGRVTEVAVIRSVHPLLDDAARKAVLQYSYSPGLKNGVPQLTTVEITVSFRIQ